MDQVSLFKSLALPESLAARGISLCRQGDGDREFLADLYVSIRWAELAPTGWPDPTKHAFLRSQFGFQTTHYAAHYAEANFWMITQDQRPIGRLYLHRGAQELRIVDISLLSEYRGTGIGGALLQAMQRDARDDGKRVSLHVDADNPARRLYRRLGFVDVEEKPPYWLMQWPG